jgi:hypothetical protein
VRRALRSERSAGIGRGAWRTARLLVAALGLATAASAQTVDPDFFITNGQVTTQVLRGNTLYVGGSFSFVGPVTGSGVPVDLVSGLPLPGFPRVNGTVFAVVPDGSGGWFLGGQFTQVGSSPRANLAHVQSDLSVSAWDPGAGNVVRTLLLRSGTLYVGGEFTTLGGITRNRLGAVDPVTGTTTSWNPNANNSVRSIADGGTSLLVGGAYTTIGGQPRNRLARIDYGTGAADPGWNPNANGLVLQVTLDSGPGVVYVVGQFTSVGGQGRNRIAAVDASTGAVSSWNPNANSNVMSLLVSDGTVYVGGQFTNVGGQPRNRIAALSASTGLASSWNPNAGNIVQALALVGTTIVAGGDFLTIGGQSRSRLAALEVATGLATVWNPSAFNSVTCLQPDGTHIFVGGAFNGIGGTPRNNLAAFDVTTGQVTAWNPNANSQVQAFALGADVLYVGGNFTLLGGQVRNNIAALDLTNGQPTAWDPNSDGQVSALALAGDRVYAGGLFNTIGGQPRLNMAALDAATGQAHAWVVDADNQVFAIDASTPTVYLGGNFLTVNSTSRSFVAAASAATGAVTTWDPDATGTVRTLAVACDRVFVGGFFTSIGGQMRNRLATVDVAGGLALPWDPNANGPVFTVVPAPGTVYLGGVLSTVAGVPRNRIAAVDPQTAALSAWNPNSNGTVRAVAFDATRVYVGGAFTSMSGVPSGNLAVMTPDPAGTCPAIALTPPPLPAGVQGTPYAAGIAASGGAAPYCYRVSEGALPAGIALDPASGALSGTPATPGAWVFTVTATDDRGCLGAASYTVSITAAPPSNVVAAAGAGLCLDPAQTCVSVPFTLTRGDAIALRAVSVTFQLESGRLQLCNPVPAANVQLGDWASAFPNRNLQVTDLGGGRYTVDLVLLGAACGETGGGTLFTVNVAAVGPTGTGSITVTSVFARDCANAPVAVMAGAAGSVGISGAVLALSPGTLPDGQIGVAYDQTLTLTGASGPATFAVTAGALPPGLSLSPAGILTGLPSLAGAFGFTVTGSEANGCSDAQPYTITVACASLAIQPPYLPDGAVGSPYSFTLLTTGGLAPLVFTLDAGALPAGLSLSPGGTLDGTPTAAGTFVFTARATDAAGCTSTRDYLFDVFASPPVSSVAAQTTGLAISSANPCVSVPVVYTRGESTPVRGLTVSFQIDPARLALCSTPAASIQLGSWFAGFPNAHLQVIDEGGGAYTVDLTLLGSPCGITVGGTLFTVDLESVGPDGDGSVAVTRVRARDCGNVAVPVMAGTPTALRIQNTDITLAPANLPNGVVGTPYVQVITAESGLAPFTFGVTSGSLPPGLALAPDGTLSGTPTTTGSFAFTVSVTDVGGVPGSRPYTMSVTCPVISLTPGTLPDGQVGVAYSVSFSGSGGTAPYTFEVVAGTLPAGLSLSPAGELTGTPTAPGAAALTLRATDALGCDGDEVYTLAVFVDPAISRVVALTQGLCLSAVHTCVSVPFVYQKGDTAEAIGAHVTFQLDPRFQLCTPATPENSILEGSWLSGFTNRVFQVIDHGGGSYTVDQALLGEPCGPTTGGVLFTVNVAAAGGDGAGDITLTDVRIRDCANDPLPGQAGAPAQLIVSHAPPPAVTDLASAQVTSGNGSGGRTGITLTWTSPAPGVVALYRAPFGAYPEYDDGGGAAPDTLAAPGAPWTLVSANAASGLVDQPSTRGSWHYVAFLTDSCGNVSAVSNRSLGSLNYHLGDVSDGAVRGQGDNRVQVEDVSLLGAHYGISGAALETDSVAYLDVGPTVNGLPTGRPATDDLLDFEDLMIFSTNFLVVSAPAATGRPAPPKAGTGEAFELEAPVLVSEGDETSATLRLSASGAMQGFSVRLAWNAGVVQPLDVTGAGFLEGQGGIVLSPGGGAVDGALLGLRGRGITGSGDVATIRFRALRDGDPALRIAHVIARDPANRPLDPSGFSRSVSAAPPARTVLLAPAPNPAVGSATLAFALAEPGEADLHIYGVDGRRVRTLARGRRDPGVYRLAWRGEDDAGRALAPGVYWARLTTMGRTFNRRIVFLR